MLFGCLCPCSKRKKFTKGEQEMLKRLELCYTQAVEARAKIEAEEAKLQIQKKTEKEPKH